jgi:hypothetical protein
MAAQKTFVASAEQLKEVPAVLASAIINATPHEISIYHTVNADEAPRFKIPPFSSRESIRLVSTAQELTSKLESLHGAIPVITPQVFTDVVVPQAYERVWYDPSVALIVSLPVAEFIKSKRANVFTVASGPMHAVRSHTGQILGTVALEKHS